MTDSIPSADEIIRDVCKTMHPQLEAIVHQYCDEAYGAIMESVQDYLVDNAAYNIGQRLSSAERRAALAERQLRAVDRELRWEGTGKSRIETIWLLYLRLRSDNTALNLIAAYGDERAADHLAQTGSYGMFDEPGSVQIAREALNAKIEIPEALYTSVIEAGTGEPAEAGSIAAGDESAVAESETPNA